MPGQDVDAIWAKLKASTAPRSVMAKPAATRALPTTIVTGNKPGCLTVGAGKAALKEHVPAVTPQYESPEQIKQQIARLQEALKSDNMSQRVQSCKQLQDLIQYLANQQQHSALLQECMEGSCGKALIARFADKSQVIRETAVSAFTTGLQAAPGAVLALIPYVFPVLDERIGRSDTAGRVEPDDAVRALLAQLVLQLIQLGARALGAYGDEIQAILAGLLADSYDKVNLLACEALEALNVALGLRLSSIAKQMVAAALPLTTHRKFTVRVAALRAVRATMHQGAHEMILEMIAWRDPNVVPIAAFYGDDLKVNFAGKLATDSHHQVRLEWVITLGDWMLNLRERVDHEPRLLPYLLSALTDPVPAVSCQAVQVLHALGAAYETEHAKELDEATRYLPTSAQGLGWQEALTGRDGSSVVAAVSTAPPTGVTLPDSLTQDWGLGVKRIVQGQCGRSLYALLQELFTWQAESRRAAATLLRTMLWLASDAIHQHVHTLIPALCRAVPDPEVQACVVDCMAITAAALPPGLLLGLLLPRLSDTQVDIPTQAGIIKLLTAVARGGAQRPDFLPCISTLLEVLTSGEEPLAGVSDTQLHAAACDLLSAVIQAAGRRGVQQHMNKFLVAAMYLSSTTGRSISQTDGNTRGANHLSQLADVACVADGTALLQGNLLNFLDHWDPCTCPNPTTTAAVLAQLISAASITQQDKPTPSQPGNDMSGCSATGTSENASRPAGRDASTGLSAAVQRAWPTVCRNVKACVVLLEALQHYFTHASNKLQNQQQHLDCTTANGEGLESNACQQGETNPWAPTLHQMLLSAPDGPSLANTCTCIGQACQSGHLTATQLLDQPQHVNTELGLQQQGTGDDACQSSMIHLLCSRASVSLHAPARLESCHSLGHSISAVNACYIQGALHRPSDSTNISSSSLETSLQATASALTARLSDSQVAVRQAASCVLLETMGFIKDLIAENCSNDLLSHWCMQLKQQVAAAKASKDDSVTAHTLDRVLAIL